MKIGILTAGGDAPGMNAAIRAVVRSALLNDHEIVGIIGGFKGIIEENFMTFDHETVSGLLLKGGTILQTSKYPEFKDELIQKKASKILKKHNFDALVCIGGSGTYSASLDISNMGVKCIVIPGTIDNDIYGTDYTIGFSTAVNTIVESIDKLRDTSTSHQRCSIIEVMGKHSGDLALYSGICGGAEFIITPENKIRKDVIIKRMVEFKQTNRRHAIIVVTENILDVHDLARDITKASGFTCRATVLGYIQRGGQPVPEDRILACRMGNYAVDLLQNNISGVGIGIVNTELKYLPLEEIVKNKKNKNTLYSLAKKIS